jgi:hypothetical protein
VLVWDWTGLVNTDVAERVFRRETIQYGVAIKRESIAHKRPQNLQITRT